MSESTCVIDGCGKPVRGRGWCSPHYNRWHRYGDPLGGPGESPTCTMCGAPTAKQSTGPRAKYCSTTCRSRAARVSAAGVAARESRQRAAKKPQQLVQCDSCASEFLSARSNARYCSKKCLGQATRNTHSKLCATEDCNSPRRAKGLCVSCYNRSRRAEGLDAQPWNDRRRDRYHRRRALKAQASTGRPVLLAEIRERDGNRCHLCRKLVSNKPWPHRSSPSLDHVIPLSRGGAHNPDNVRLAHLGCNVEKGANGGNEQLLLIG